MPSSRRQFIKSSTVITAASLGALSAKQASAAPSTSEPGVLYEGYAIEPLPNPPGVQEVTLTTHPDGRQWLLFGENRRLVQKFSDDHGRSWSDTSVVPQVNGDDITLARDNAHLTLLQLKSGKLAIVYGGRETRPGRDGTVLFCTSEDSGKTWSRPVAVDPLFAVCRTQAARVLSSGRIVVPVMKWISPATGGNSESAEHNLTFSWVYYSDDEGQAWHRSYSELFVSLDQGRRGVTHFEETVLEERPDGTLFMLGRTELGELYKSTSVDQGVSWTHPVAAGLASSYAPGTLIRIPKTRDLLLVWNQVSVEEILTGLHRQRLSTAISQDEGETWTHYRNLESMDDRTQIEPPSGPPNVVRMVDYGYRQPTDKDRYPHAPGCLRICYATVAFADDEVTITYDYGYGVNEFKDKSATKVKIVSLDWLYERV